jgi:hypothetical protein
MRSQKVEQGSGTREGLQHSGEAQISGVAEPPRAQPHENPMSSCMMPGPDDALYCPIKESQRLVGHHHTLYSYYMKL